MGAAAGVMLFSRALVWLLHHYHRGTILLITGVLTGSLWVIWPFQERTYEVVGGKSRLIQSTPFWPSEWSLQVAAAAALIAAGIVIVLGLHGLSRKRLGSI